MNDTMSPSTVAMLILFGSIIFATIGIAARVWHWGDMRGTIVCIDIFYGEINATYRSYDILIPHSHVVHIPIKTLQLFLLQYPSK